MIRRLPVRLGGALVALLLASAPVQASAPRQLGISVGDPGQPHALDRIVRLERARPPLVMWYQSWSEPLFYPRQMRAVSRVGATPIITWSPRSEAGPIPLDEVADGSHDDYLKKAAYAANDFGRPLYIRFAHEMNLLTTVYRSSHLSDSPASFRRAWRHVVSVFRSAGANNVKWIWSPNIDCGGRCPFTAFYPGDAWVDWVALDGYNNGTSASWSRWTPLGELFGPSYRTLGRLTRKPMMIGETGSADIGGSKPDWILRGLLHDVPEQLPRVRVVIWFNRDKEHNWQIDSSRDSLQAFRAVVRSSLYGGPSPAAVQGFERAARLGARPLHEGAISRAGSILVAAGVLLLVVLGLIAVLVRTRRSSPPSMPDSSQPRDQVTVR